MCDASKEGLGALSGQQIAQGWQTIFFESRFILLLERNLPKTKWNYYWLDWQRKISKIVYEIETEIF